MKIKQDLEGHECINQDRDEKFNPEKLEIDIFEQVLLHTGSICKPKTLGSVSKIELKIPFCKRKILQTLMDGWCY